MGRIPLTEFGSIERQSANVSEPNSALNLCDSLPMYPEASPSSEGGSLVWLFA
jgi:hypothetical protein